MGRTRTSPLVDGDAYLPAAIALMLDFSSGRFRNSLAETVAWCKILSLEGNADSDDTRYRHALYVQAAQQWQEARLSANRGWLSRKISATKEWQHAMGLWKQIRDSLGPMDHKLRSPELKPSLGLEGTDAAWETAVTELVAKPSQLTSKVSSGGDALNATGARLLL